MVRWVRDWEETQCRTREGTSPFQGRKEVRGVEAGSTGILASVRGLLAPRYLGDVSVLPQSVGPLPAHPASNVFLSASPGPTGSKRQISPEVMRKAFSNVPHSRTGGLPFYPAASLCFLATHSLPDHEASITYVTATPHFQGPCY